MNKMDMKSSRRVRSRKALVVWDGSRRNIAQANQVIANLGSVAVHTVHAMPHESIYHYGNVCHEGPSYNVLEMELHQKFDIAIKPFKAFEGSTLSLLFGDRVQEISRFVNRFKFGTVIMPEFNQSLFSRWIHGDLTEKLLSLVNGDVIVLDDMEANTETHVDNESPFLNFAHDE